MADNEDVVTPVGGESEADVLARILSPQTPTVEPVPQEPGQCINCANNGKVSKLDNGECPACGFHA